MNSISEALVDYWKQLPVVPTAVRRRRLESTRLGVRAGELPPAEFTVFALGDVDEEVVFNAASEYVGSTGAAPQAAAIDDALEWIRRDLALNRGAVFAALLTRGDRAVHERLASLRLVLSTSEVATVCRRAGRRPCEHARAFLDDWHGLLSGEALAAEREHVAGALEALVTMRAA